jgi:hypothetical protein
MPFVGDERSSATVSSGRTLITSTRWTGIGLVVVRVEFATVMATAQIGGTVLVKMATEEPEDRKVR